MFIEKIPNDTLVGLAGMAGVWEAGSRRWESSAGGAGEAAGTLDERQFNSVPWEAHSHSTGAQFESPPSQGMYVPNF